MSVNFEISLSLSRVLIQKRYELSTYEVYEGKLYLTNGTTRTVQVNVSEKDHPRIQGFIKEFFEYLSYVNLPKFKSGLTRPPQLWEIVKRLDDEKRILDKALKSYSFSHGIPFIETNNEQLYAFIQESMNVPSFHPLNGAWKNPDRFVRKIVAEALKVQEENILRRIPKEILESPELLRSYLIDLLNQIGLSYKSAVEQFDWSWGKPESGAIESSYAIAKLIAQADLWVEIKSKETTKFSFQDVWRFSIDGSQEPFGAYIFEDEPFYILSSLRGLKEILQSKKPLSQKTYESYAAALLCNPPIFHRFDFLQWDSKWIIENHERCFFNPKMQNRGQCFVWVPTLKQDPLGIADLTDRYEKAQAAEKEQDNDDKNYFIANSLGFVILYHFQLNCKGLRAKTPTTHTLITNRIFLGLEQILTHAKTPGERLIAYIWTARELEITHQLNDGNGRTSISTLIKLIMEDPELPKYIPEDPNILDLQGPETILRDVYSGMIRFKELSQEDKEGMIDVETLVDQAQIRNAPWDVVHKRAELPNEVIVDLVQKDRVAKKVKH